MGLQGIDINFDFTTDSPHYWERFWENNEGLGAGGCDPDSASKTLQHYHQMLWSRQLPNGAFMDLKMGSGREYLTWGEFCFGSDSITASFRYKRYREMIEQVSHALPDYREYMERFLRRTYTMGGTIIFPKRQGGINQSRGRNRRICDRWDLTLECIRKYYVNEQSPLYDVLLEDRRFFDLFVDFKGYVDFFFLQDCVTTDYSGVKFWLGEGSFNEDPLPRTVSEYFMWIEHQLQFVDARNQRIKAACQTEQR